MPNPRQARYAAALERVYDLHPAAAHAIELYVSDLRAECAQRRRAARDAAAQADTTTPQTTGPHRPGSTITQPPRRTP